MLQTFTSTFITKEFIIFKFQSASLMSFKSAIKSKKQKLNEKKFSKGNSPAIVDVISSSQDEHYRSQEKIQKRRNYSGKPVNTSNDDQVRPYIPRVLDLKKISAATLQTKQLSQNIIYKSSKAIDDSDTLLVVETAQQQNPETISRDRSLFSYKVEGKEGIKYVSQMHIKGRINSQIKEIQAKETKKIEKQQVFLERIMDGSFPSDNSLNTDDKKQKNKQQGEQPAQRKRAARYFEDAQSDDEGQENVVKCFRCFKKGHIAKNCIQEEPKQCCNFCLGEHHHTVCDSSPCFKCCQPGHISQDCRSTGIECRKCKKRGHKSDNCGIYLPLDYHNKNDDYIKHRFKKSDLKKLKCLRFCKNPEGHFNCFSYQSKNELVPYANFNNRRRSEQERAQQRQRHIRMESRMYGC